MFLRSASALLLLLASASGAVAQDYVGGQKVFGAWQSLGFAPLMSVALTTSNEAFGAGVLGPVAKICNTGANPAYVLLSTSGSTAATTTTATLFPAGVCGYLAAAGQNHAAAISTTGVTTLNIELGSGNIGYTH